MALQLDRLDHFIMAVPDLDAAYAPLTRLGLTVSPPGPASDAGVESCAFFVGGLANFVSVEFLAGIADADDGAYLLGFAVDDLAAAREAFGAQLGGFDESVARVLDNQEIKTLRPKDTSAAGCSFVVLEYPPALIAMQESITQTGSDFPLQRIDHLAIIPPDMEAGTRYWTDVLGVPLHDELQGSGFTIRQMKVGDLMVELLAPSGPDSPIAGAAPGMRSMIACEVDDVAACVALARERGFTIGDPGPGPLPGTLVATIAPDEIAGLAIQLL
ncbi:MAG: VOC family protein, partial [Acidimicrobiia bacterium]